MTQLRNSILTLALSLLIGGARSMVAQSQETARPPQVPPATGPAMQPAAPPKPLPAFYRNLIVLDAAHGGQDHGAQLSTSAVEKDVTLAFVQKLRPALTAQGFTVVVTRDSDPPEELTTDQRAGTANHVRPLACLVIHAAATGSGVHLVSSSLPETEVKSSSSRVLLWNRAQAPVVGMSLRLANEVGLTIGAAQLPVLLLRASVPPLDNLICPAIAIELAPLKTSSGNPTAATDSGYQQRAATAIANGLASFRNHNAPPPPPAPPGLLPRPGVPQ